jgi:hypothetical protein
LHPYTYSGIIQALHDTQWFDTDYSDALTIKHSSRFDSADLTAERSYIFQNSAYLFGQRPQVGCRKSALHGSSSSS